MVGQEMYLRLSYPPPQLNPNARVHHVAEHRAFQSYKREALLETRAALGRDKWQWDGCTFLAWITPPNVKRRRDFDNACAALKAARDGIAETLEIDDSEMALFYPSGRFEPASANHPLGHVLVAIRPPDVVSAPLLGEVR